MVRALNASRSSMRAFRRDTAMVTAVINLTEIGVTPLMPPTRLSQSTHVRTKDPDQRLNLWIAYRPERLLHGKPAAFPLMHLLPDG
jgi:hypothetical protein